MKVVGGYAKTHFDRGFDSLASYDDDMFSVRLRLMYLYYGRACQMTPEFHGAPTSAHN